MLYRLTPTLINKGYVYIAESPLYEITTKERTYFAYTEPEKAAALKFSMGRITMPHQLARLVLTEQIYRACTINAGMKYHK